ncbi:hypothetical protein TrVE_jg1404 [Triparma verrucosa]|uniref:Adenylate kinase n=1 Tax=Triparma verrucosa TaxID=1606542 RepID=A0A9W7F8H0_9STRA|nr:hypothetical protein TrVE_jg1404 [Triparma verrucosa]
MLPKKAPKKGTGLGPKRNSKKNKAAAKVGSQTPTRSSSGSVWKSPGANEAQTLTTASCPKIIIAGAPASGKGTQCEIIKARYDVVHLSTGDMLRAAVAAGSELGKKAKAQMEAGELVSDEVIIGAVKERLAQQDCKTKGWLLDGFPRTRAQADALASAGITCDSFVFLKVPDEILVERVVGRRTDPDTGKIYHLKFSPPPTEEIKKRLTHRADDTEEKVKVRLQAFHENVNSIASCYTSTMFEVKGDQDKKRVEELITNHLDKLFQLPPPQNPFPSPPPPPPPVENDDGAPPSSPPPAVLSPAEEKRKNFKALASTVHDFDTDNHDEGRHIDHDFCYKKAAGKSSNRNLQEGLSPLHSPSSPDTMTMHHNSANEVHNSANPLTNSHSHVLKQQISSSLFEFPEEIDDDEDDDDWDFFSSDHAIDKITGLDCDHKFHWVFAIMLHLVLTSVTYFALLFALDPESIENMMRVRLLNPFGLLSLLLVMLGTDDIDSRMDLDAYKTGHVLQRLLKSCPNFCYTAFNLLVQKAMLLVGYLRIGDRKGAVAHIVMIILYPFMGRILHRIRVKMASTIPEDDFETASNQQLPERSRGNSHASHTKNYKGFKLTKGEFKDIVLTQLPYVGFTTILTISYFSFEGYGCIHNARLKEAEYVKDHGIPLANVTYCHELPLDQCTSSGCISWIAECDDVVESSEAFSLLFVVLAGIKLYVLPLAKLRYNFLNFMSFDMLFRDQIQTLLFAFSAFSALFLFASADEIDDYCEYTNPANLAIEDATIFRERSLKQRKVMNLVVRVLFFLTIFCSGLRSDLSAWKGKKHGKGKKRYGCARWLQRKFSTKEVCAVAPVFRNILLLIAMSLCFGVNTFFLYFAWKAREEGTFDSKSARLAENAYAIFVSSWAFIFCCVGIYYFSRPKSKGFQKNFVYALIPLNSILCGIGCIWMEDWENSVARAAEVDFGVPGEGPFGGVFSKNLIYNFCTAAVTIVFWPILGMCNDLLIHDYNDASIQKHLKNLFSSATTILAPACFLFAEGTGCVHAHSYRGCYALVEANFTIELYLILSYCYFLIFGFTLSHFTIDDLLNFNAPTSLILQLVAAFASSLLAFAAFGMRPRENDDAAEYEDGLNPNGVYKQDATLNSILNIRFAIVFIWFLNYCTQGVHVYRQHKSVIKRGETAKEKQDRKTDKKERSWVSRKERKFVKWIEHLLRVEKGDFDVRVSRFFTGVAFTFVVLSLVTAILVLQSPEVGEAIVVKCTPAEIKAFNITDTDECYLPQTEEAKLGAFNYIMWQALSDFSHVMGVFVVMSNLSSNQPKFRVIDVLTIAIMSGVFFIVGNHPSLSSDQWRSFLYGSLVLIFCALALKAKRSLIEYFSPTELKKHILTMTLGMLSQLAPIIFLQCEYFGCALRGYRDENPSHKGFNLVTVHEGMYCGALRVGTKSVSFQVAMILIMGFVVGLYIKYSAHHQELTIAKISHLKMSRFNVFQLFTFLLTSFIALYLFGTRGKANDFYSKRGSSDTEDIFLLTVYFLWFILLSTEAISRVKSVEDDEKFKRDLNKEKSGELEMMKDIEQGKAVHVGTRAKKGLWEISDDYEDKKAKEKIKKQFELQKYESGRFKKAKARGTAGNFEVPDFSPGML